MFSSFRMKLLGLLVLTLAIGTALTGVSMWRLLYLERLSETGYREIVEAREELKQLSSELLSAQESERRRISRELHDEVGQVMSATMLAAGNLRAALKQDNAEEALHQLHLIEEMTERNTSVVRNISLLLRPAVLDDLGLVPALRWLAREVSRNQAVQVDVLAEELPGALPEDHRTCVYRVVQESLRNACRHSGAQQVRIQVQQPDHRIRVSVQDDGKGFDPALETGMGILGMEERVVRLGGVLKVDSEQGRGTTVLFELPLPEMIDLVD
jgi:signal transduction histidine kinase